MSIVIKRDVLRHKNNLFLNLHYINGIILYLNRNNTNVMSPSYYT